MKFGYFVTLAFGLGFASANPIEKRASTGDKATIGYATLYGGQVTHHSTAAHTNLIPSTTGGGSASPIVVTTLAALKSALSSGNKVVLISGTIVGNEVIKVPANTSVIGKFGAGLSGVGLRVIDVSNVIIRNLKISKVLADAGDAIGIQSANRVWVDSVDLWSDRDHDKDYYDGLLDITHGSYGISVTNSHLHDHWKASLVGHSDSNGDEDIALEVTFAYNKWENLSSRTPSIRFGHAHIFNNYFLNNDDGINVRDGAEVLIQCNVFENVANPIYSTNNGYANVASNNDLGGGTNTAPSTSWNNPGYPIPACIPVAQLKAYINAHSGAILPF
ncbi:hypothetical protein FRC06_010530 [Ceratobasidium sp. 370]|nr:hypothetical protein FRC06_010530 [Ceratobasidium sp. 370]